MRPYTTIFPKPLVPIGDRPILEILVGQLARAGVERIDLCVGHLGELIQAYFSDAYNGRQNVEFRYHWEHAPLGTAGALRQVDDLDEPFLVLNGDVLTDLDFGELMRFHEESGSALTIAACEKSTHTSLGVIELNGENVTGYAEKPTITHTVSMGIYVYDPSAVEHIPEGRADFPDVVSALLEAGKAVSAYRFEGEWLDVGTPEDHERALELVEANPELLDLG